ncbi:OprO/OprP family phosphate-selective porin [Methyloradius palustris]|uniref:Porin O n=1 Tax=Methyloradius palustris TaxID=2778876 RepID=A0A8D5G755_9PROT|nr:porin [Methyloradius palustris]BCM24397.1 porin O [Methyloradius palustris]
MQFKLKTITFALIAGGVLLNTNVALADDASDLQALKETIHELDQKIKILERKNELADEKAVEDKKTTPVIKTGSEGFGFQSGDGKNAIYLNGRVQADYHAYGKSDAQNADSFDLRRAYLTIQGKVNGDYDFKVTGDFAQQNNFTPSVTTSSTKTILDEAYFGINWWKEAKFRFGQFNMPFGLENYTSDLFNDFSERAVTEALTPSKERGAMVHGVPIEGTYYGLALSTGRGKNADNLDTQVDGPEVIGRGIINLAKFAKLDDTVIHLGGSFSHGYISGNQSTNNNTLTTNSFLVGQGNASSKTEGNGITFFTPTGLGIGAGNDIERTRLGAEAAIAYGPVKLQSEYVTHNYSGVSTTTGFVGPFDKDIDAWYVSANWLVTGESYASSYLPDGTWGRIKPRQNFGLTGTGIGAIVLGLRYSEYDASDFATGVGAPAKNAAPYASNQPTGSHAWTGAATWILNPNTRLLLNYIDTRFEGGSILVKNDQGTGVGLTNGEKALTLRGQFDF